MSEEKKYPFLKETVKDEQVTGKKIAKIIGKTIGKGLLFGLAACLAFCVLKPWMETVFMPKQAEVLIPKDDAESAEGAETKEEEKLTAENYREMNEALNQVAEDARRCVVEIAMKDAENDWKEERKVQNISGMIVWDNGVNVLILAPKGEFKKSDEVQVTFADNQLYRGTLKHVDRNLKIGIFAVPKSSLKQSTISTMKVAELGNSYLLKKGAPVIAIGMQFGYSDGMGYGVVSSLKNEITLADYTYSILTTDITAASQGTGVLFNIDGEVVGIVDQKRTDITSANLVSGYAISEMKESIERLSNGKGIPYLGIVTVEVTKEISEREEIPKGLYVKEVEAESPAMEAGIQCGDIIVEMGSAEIATRKGYSMKLMQCMEGTPLQIQVMRLGAEEYEKLSLNAVVGVK